MDSEAYNLSDSGANSSNGHSNDGQTQTLSRSGRRGRSRSARGRRACVVSRPKGGRGRIRRRGGQTSSGRPDVTAERNAHLLEHINNLPEENLRELVLNVCQRNPSLIFNILEESTRHHQGGYHPRPDQEQPDWCSCTHCREMPSEQERLCCGQIQQNCFSRLADFEVVVLDDLVLHLSILYRQNIFAIPDDEERNRSYRHAAYRQYVLWQYGRLGAGNRRTIPSCCVWRIRDKYPNAFGQYRGFVAGRLG